jgi:hypothetical protein
MLQKSAGMLMQRLVRWPLLIPLSVSDLSAINRMLRRSGMPVPKQNLGFATAYHWIFDRRLPSSREARKALASTGRDVMLSRTILSATRYCPTTRSLSSNSETSREPRYETGFWQNLVTNNIQVISIVLISFLCALFALRLFSKAGRRYARWTSTPSRDPLPVIH